MKPKIRILAGADGLYWCGLFECGYSSFGRVGYMSLAQAIRFYCKVLAIERL
jgi:hypothetical protein